MSIILGISSSHESSAALLRDGKLIAAVSEERLSRIKNDGYALPNRAIVEVLRIGGVSRRDVDHVALMYTSIPERYFRRETMLKELERKLSRAVKRLWGKPGHDIWADHLLQKIVAAGQSFDTFFKPAKFLREEGFRADATVRFFDHHMAHAMLAGYYSGFDEAAVFTLDGRGDLDIHHTTGQFHRGALTRDIVSDNLGASAGAFYMHITELLGFKPLRHEGKILGLAAFGDPQPLEAAFTKCLRIAPDGLHLDSDFSAYADGEHRMAEYLRGAIQGHSRENVAAAAQTVFEKTLVDLIRRYLDKTGLVHVALNGGVFANVKLNQRIAALPQVEQIFVFPGMSDTGNSVGAALLYQQALDGEVLEKKRCALTDVYLGPEFNDTEIETELSARKLRFEKPGEEALVARSAQAIHAGRIVGWFQGRMEFGPRALGNRSMVARPTDADINKWLNARLERTEFMPFAPSVMEEYADEIFEGVEKARHAAEFMTVTFDVKKEWRPRIPAVVHVDGTARPQLVTTRTNPRYHALISAYQKLSGIPAVLNTSFNAHEEPIVCTPADAIQAFQDNRIDCLAIGSFWLEHPPS